MNRFFHRSRWMLGTLLAVLLSAFLSAYSTIRMMKPSPPRLDDASQWILVKTTQHALEGIRVYMFRHDSSEWDPYDVRQNKIVVTLAESHVQYEFMWPSNYPFAAGWCEVTGLPDGSVVIVLFESEYAVRVVRFVKGTFIFRPSDDEAISVQPLSYEDKNRDGLPEFVSSDEVWRWSVSDGFFKSGAVNRVN